MIIAGVASALPKHYYNQEFLTLAMKQYWGDKLLNPRFLDQLHSNVGVAGRYLALPIEEYARITSWGEANSAWIRVAQEIGEQALRGALERAGLSPRDLSALFVVSITGVASPSLDARLINRMGLAPDIKRVPIFGLGCVAGAAGLSRVADVLRGAPGEVAVLLAVELCSLTLQREDLSIPNIIASGLFGDGAAAAVLDGGARGRGPRVVATRSVFYPGTERVMGWDVVDSGFKVVLSPGVPQLVRERLRGDVDAFLSPLGLRRADIAHFVCHTGGPRVLEAFEEALEVPRAAMQRSWDSLQGAGNLSSASVLFVLSDLLASGEARPGDRGLLLAMGPGFCSELVLLEW